MKHFVMSQPAAMMDGVLMAWQIGDMGRRYAMSIWLRRSIFQRGSGTATNASGRNNRANCPAKATSSGAATYISHQIGSSVMSKLTSALQWTDADFSRRFKSKVRNEVDGCPRLGQNFPRAALAMDQHTANRRS